MIPLDQLYVIPATDGSRDREAIEWMNARKRTRDGGPIMNFQQMQNRNSQKNQKKKWMSK